MKGCFTHIAEVAHLIPEFPLWPNSSHASHAVRPSRLGRKEMVASICFLVTKIPNVVLKAILAHFSTADTNTLTTSNKCVKSTLNALGGVSETGVLESI